MMNACNMIPLTHAVRPLGPRRRGSNGSSDVDDPTGPQLEPGSALDFVQTRFVIARRTRLHFPNTVTNVHRSRSGLDRSGNHYWGGIIKLSTSASIQRIVSDPTDLDRHAPLIHCDSDKSLRFIQSPHLSLSLSRSLSLSLSLSLSRFDAMVSSLSRSGVRL